MDKENLAESLREIQRDLQLQGASSQVEAYIKMLMVVFDKSTAYFNLMIVGAYAGFFGLWQLAKDYLSKNQVLWSALLVFVSLFFFVLFEVSKMVVAQKDITAQAEALRSSEHRSDPRFIAQRMDEIATAYERTNFNLMRFWVVTMRITVGAGLSGAGVLVWALISGLAM